MTDSRLEKIRALIATAESFTRGGNHAAAASYNAKAQELMTKWSIEEAQIAGMRNAGSTDIDVTYLWEPYSPYQEPKIQLLSTVARHNNCQVLVTKGCYRSTGRDGTFRDRYYTNSKGGAQKWVKIHVIGRQRDREFTEMLYTSLLVQCETEFQSREVQDRMAAQTFHPGHRIRWRNSFVQGYSLGVGRRLLDAKQTVINATPGAALVLADSSQAVTQWVGEKYGKLGAGKGSNAGGGAGLLEGREAGLRADVGQSRISNDNRKALK